jgi:hypothetical protein
MVACRFDDRARAFGAECAEESCVYHVDPSPIRSEILFILEHSLDENLDVGKVHCLFVSGLGRKLGCPFKLGRIEEGHDVRAVLSGHGNEGVSTPQGEKRPDVNLDGVFDGVLVEATTESKAHPTNKFFRGV